MTMTAETIKKSISYVSNAEGETSALLVDIKSKEVAEYFEDLLDTLEAEKRMSAGGGRSFAEFKQAYLSKRK